MKQLLNSSPDLFSIGLDIGYGHTKYSGGVFESRVKLACMFDSNVEWDVNKHEVVYDNKTYIVGDGAGLVTDRRYFNKNYKICLLTAIALSYKNELIKNRQSIRPGVIEINANTVIGSPAGKYRSLAPEIMEHFNELGIEDIKVDGIDYRINLVDLFVYFEGAVIVKYANKGHVISIDIGASTTDITEWENCKLKTTPISLNMGMSKLHGRIADHYNNTYKTNFLDHQGEGMLKKRLAGETQWITSNNAIIDLTDIDILIEEFVSLLLENLDDKADFNNASDIIISGGGAEIVGDSLMDQLGKSRKIDNAQMLNQEIYQIVAEARAEEIKF